MTTEPTDVAAEANAAMDTLVTTALRVKRERDEAITILRDLLKDYDEESMAIYVGGDEGCLECTAGTPPDRLNTGPCAFHRAKAAIARQGL